MKSSIITQSRTHMLTSLHLDSSVTAHRVSLGRESRWAKGSLAFRLRRKKRNGKGDWKGENEDRTGKMKYGG